MGQRTSLVLALVLLAGGLTVGAPVQQAEASHDTDPTQADPLTYGTYDGVTYQSKGEHNGHLKGFKLTEHGSIVVGPGGALVTLTAEKHAPGLNNDYRVTTNETLGFSVSPPDSDHYAFVEAELDYNPGEVIDSPVDAPGDQQQNDLYLLLVNEGGDVLKKGDAARDFGSESSVFTTTEAGRFHAAVGANHGNSPVNLEIGIDYRHCNDPNPVC